MIKLFAGAVLLAASVACNKPCPVSGTVATGTDSVIVTGGDTVIVSGGDSVVVMGGDSIALAADAPTRTILCKLMLRDQKLPRAAKKRLYVVTCAPRR
jgi:hypothetical protein